MSPIVYYLTTLVVFFFIFAISTWGLNLQFGTAGILNFTYITFFAIGGYFTGVSMLGRPDALSNMRYILGLNLPFPIALLIGATAAGVLGLLVGLVALRRLRSDYLAIVTVSVGAIVYDFVNVNTGLFNGADGIAGIPYPFNDSLNLDPNTYTFFYIALTGLVTLVLGLLAFRIYNSPLGRTLRAIREDADVASAFGKDSYRFRMIAMVVGCVYAGIAGGLLVGFISALNPGGWVAGETFLLYAALLLGGRGNNWGALLGAFLVPVLFQEATRYLPQIPGHAELIPALRNMIVGGLLIAVLWFRPEGILPERKAKFPGVEYLKKRKAALEVG
ncbi:MAG: branched-chain amino acid ABC transporter permease [Candidatus Dormibacteraeota bacterium]|uniref:Branched-chain amino acid ABC transporter permease n=1 Tax=Candidatus Dormiibacter inghamiae TaxID=3127013 RepID=A0A934KFN2_9BACT|nr:branched-chain amino acid ABC transporter permease [Candidatus Dormibacteraeota bacterium]MBJ7606293.1 branched-chain amino acid ABC transporter permease [Candidatus Dormibacteraeota bacterium]